MPLAAQADQGRGYPRQFLGDRLREQSSVQPAPAPNRVSVAQQGSGNGAGVLQTGTANTAGILQFGQGNTGVITQDGSNNTACLIQAGRNLNGSVQQVGDNQSDGLLQTRWGSEVVPVQLCSADTTRRDLRAYATPNPRADVRTRARPMAQRQ
jgi:hypothetical protein